METKPYTPQVERRYIQASVAKFEQRAATDGNTIVRGYAAVFNSLSEDLGGFKEQIAPGFFDNVLANDVRALFNHDSNLILGRTVAGTCRIGVDAVGLWFEYDAPKATYSTDLLESMSRGDVTQCSFQFSIDYTANGDLWDKQADGSYIRTLLKALQLYDVSPVTYPAYPDTTVGLRSLESAKKNEVPPIPAFDFARSIDRVHLAAN